MEPESLSPSKIDSNTFWQYVIALDVQYNSSRNFDARLKSLYLKRRNQLFRMLSKSELSSFRSDYLRLRYSLLCDKYGNTKREQRKLSHARNNSNTSFLSFIYEDLVNSPNQKRVPTESLTPNHLLFDEAIPTQLSTLPNQAFCDNFQFNGVYHIFDQHHKGAVSDIKFAHNNNSLLCSSSSDGTLSIVQLTPSPPTILFVLRGHTDWVSWFEWSRSNDLIVSCSRDSTLRLWSAKNASCLRVFRDPDNSSLLVCAFHPSNNNMIVTGNSHGKLNIMNLSTGLSVLQYAIYSHPVALVSLCFQDDLFFVGDSKGVISTFSFNIENCMLKSINKVIIVNGCPITSLSYLRHNNEHFILANCACNAIVLLKFLQNKQIQFMKSFPVKHANPHLAIKSSFCPSAITNKKICIVTGSEDTNIYFYTFDDDNKTRCVNKLQGHSFPVLGVCFNHEESLLASADINGNIIIWKRNDIK